MIIGGGGYGVDLSIGNVDFIDLAKGKAAFAAAPALQYPRKHVSAVLLPDHRVLVTGGGRTNNADPVLATELYDPSMNKWTTGAPASVPRLYHGVAFLLPDGRVVTAGSQSGVSELRFEVYSPSYLFQGQRPSQLQPAPTSVPYAGRFSLKTQQARSIKYVSLVRPSAITHSFDSEQRIVDLPFTVEADGVTLTTKAPSARNVAPPGWYMLFLVDNRGVPSVASWVRLG